MKARYEIRLVAVTEKPPRDTSLALRCSSLENLENLHEALCDLLDGNAPSTTLKRGAVLNQITQEDFNRIVRARIRSRRAPEDPALHACFDIHTRYSFGTVDPGPIFEPRAETLTELLRNARERVKQSGDLLRDHYARDAEGHHVSCHHPNATRWSPAGALRRETHGAHLNVLWTDVWDTDERAADLLDEAWLSLTRALPHPGKEFRAHEREGHYYHSEVENLLMVPEGVLNMLTERQDMTARRMLEAFDTAIEQTPQAPTTPTP